MSSNKEVYFEIKCPLCDSLITNALSSVNMQGELCCPSCGKPVQLYSLISYNMWLAENKEAVKTSKKPIKSKPKIKTNIENEENTENLMGIDFQEINLGEMGFDFGSIMENLEKLGIVHRVDKFDTQTNNEIARTRALICRTHFLYLIGCGFSEEQSFDIIKILLENDYLF